MPLHGGDTEKEKGKRERSGILVLQQGNRNNSGILDGNWTGIGFCLLSNSNHPDPAFFGTDLWGVLEKWEEKLRGVVDN